MTGEPSSLFRLVCNVYAALSQEASGRDGDPNDIIFTGSIVNMIKRFTNSNADYSAVRQLLLSPHNDPCIVIVQRGSRDQKSVIELRHPPLEAWRNISRGDLTGSRTADKLSVEVEGRIAALESWREPFKEVNVTKALMNIEKRLTKLEKAFNDIELDIKEAFNKMSESRTS